MLQPDKFVCITYPQIDFLIPNEYVASCVGVKDLGTSLFHTQDSGIFDFDNIASIFNQKPRESDVKTMIVMKGDGTNHLSLVTTQECRVCAVNLSEFGLFSQAYTDQLQKFGILACNFVDDRLRLLINVQKTISYMGDSFLEEL